MKEDVSYNLVIKPENSLLDLKLKQVWQYKDLLFLLVRRDFVSFYKQTILGPLWFFIQPVITTITFTFIFGQLAGISTDGLPQPLFYMAGITAWNYFSDCLLKTSTVFRDNAAIFGKVYFPRLIIPLSIVISNLIRFGVQFFMFMLFILYYKINHATFSPNAHILLFPFLVIIMAAFGLGAGMIITALTTKYRDLAFLVSFGLQLLMYATTVIYPLSSAPKQFKAFILANPMTAVIETFRYSFLGRGEFSWGYLLVSSISSFGILLLGIIIFNKVEKTFMDTV